MLANLLIATLFAGLTFVAILAFVSAHRFNRTGNGRIFK